ncbi:DUF2274 domain-containing protein [Bradyrhizobium sp. RDT10]
MTELTAPVHRDLIAYAEALSRQTGQPIDRPSFVASGSLAAFP